MNSQESQESLTQDNEFRALINCEEIDYLKNALKGTQNNKNNLLKCQWFISKSNHKTILVKITINHHQPLLISVPIVSLDFNSLSHSNNKENNIKITLSIRELVEAIDDKFLPPDTERDQIIFIFKVDEGEVIIQQTQRCSLCVIKDQSCLQIYSDEIEPTKGIEGKEDWRFKVVDNPLFTSLIKTIASAHNPNENYFIIKGNSKDNISLLFYFGDSNEENPEYYCTSKFDIRLIKQNKKINPGLGIRYRTKEIADFLYKFDSRKNSATYSVDTKLIISIEIIKEKSSFKVQKGFRPIILY